MLEVQLREQFVYAIARNSLNVFLDTCPIIPTAYCRFMHKPTAALLIISSRFYLRNWSTRTIDELKNLVGVFPKEG